MVPALVLGDTSAVSPETSKDFRTSGLTHLTAVSGANVTIVCGAVLLAAALLGPRVAVTLAAVTLLGFVVVVQPSASVLRAAVMGAITLLAVLTHRRRQAMPALAAAIIVLMIGAPSWPSTSASRCRCRRPPRSWSSRRRGRGDWPPAAGQARSRTR